MVTTGSKLLTGDDRLPSRKPRALMEFISSRSTSISSRAKSSPAKTAPIPRSLLWRSAAAKWPAASRSPLSLRNGAAAGRSISDSDNNECLGEDTDARRRRPGISDSLNRSDTSVRHATHRSCQQDEESEVEAKEESERDESVYDWDSEASLDDAPTEVRGDNNHFEVEPSLKTSVKENTLRKTSMKENTLRKAATAPFVPYCTSDLDQLSTFCSDEHEAKRASLFEELIEFHNTSESSILMFPDYFSHEERQLLANIAHGLELGCHIGDKSSSVFKLHRSAAVLPPHVVARLRSSTIEPDVKMPSNDGGPHAHPHFDGSNADDVFVDLTQLAQQGKEGFVSKVRLRRLNSGSGVRRDMLWDVAQLSSSMDVVADRVTDGQGGVYAVQSRSSGQKLAMFKPVEEEKFVRDGLTCGEGAVREEAAYVLDSRWNGFSGVPPTAVARLQLSINDDATKHGSIQRFMTSSVGSMESFGMSFNLAIAQQFVPVEQVHRIAILDVRVFNTDRHHGNILLIGDKPPYTMVPIDHGCILPSWFHLSEARFDWLEYPQCRVPFSPSEMAHIESLDADGDAVALRRLGIREECIVTMKICTLFLQLAARHGKTLHWIGTFMQRSGCFEDAAALERVVHRACTISGVPFTFERNEFGEEKSRVPLGVLSRRPPSQFFASLQQLLLDEMAIEGSG
jgi:hypothetical protein